MVAQRRPKLPRPRKPQLARSPESYGSEEARLRAVEYYGGHLYDLGVCVLGFVQADPDVHGRLCRFIESPGTRKLLVGARGIYKTSFGTVTRALQLLLLDPDARVLIVCNTDKNARKVVMQIKHHLERNPRLRALFGPQIPAQTHDIPWSTQGLLLERPGIFSEASITATGVESQLASGHYSHILGDDIVAARRDDLKEGGLIIIRPEELEKALAWYKLTMRGLQILTEDEEKRTQVQFIVNRWAVEDFASYIMQNHLKDEDNPDGFEFLQLAAHNADGSLLLPRLLPEAELARIHDDQGDFMYYTQYECQPYNPEMRGFPEQWNAYWGSDGQERPDDWEQMGCYALMDLADSTRPSSCFTAFVVVWADAHGHLWVGEALRKKIDTNGKIELIHQMLQKYRDKLYTIHIEKNLYQETLRHTLRTAMAARGTFYRVRPLEHKNRNKDARIMRLQPHHEAGALHVRPEQRHLLQEMRDFPFSHNKDILDALGYMMDVLQHPLKAARRAQPTEEAPGRQVIYLADIKEDIDRRRGPVYGGRPFESQGPRFHNHWFDPADAAAS